MSRPSYKEIWLDEVKSNAEELEWVRDAVDGNAEVYTGEPYSEGEYLARKIMQMHSRIAELETERERVFDLVRELRTYCIFANWDNPDTEDDFNEFDVEVCKWLSKYMEREE